MFIHQPYRISNHTSPHFITFKVVRSEFALHSNGTKDIIVNSLKYCQKEKGLNIHAYCIMSNHIHLIISAESGFSISDNLRDFKRYTSVRIRRALKENIKDPANPRMIKIFRKEAGHNKRNTRYKLWENDNHAVEIYTKKFFEQKLNYIHMNPVRAGLCDSPQEYEFSSAQYYQTQEGRIEIDFLRW